MENIWQFCKLYEKVPKTTQKYSRWDPSVIWDHPAETHFIRDPKNPDDGELTPEYFRWRKKGFEAKNAIRYPVGYHHRTKCLCALKEDQFDQALNYVESRKQIYLPLYCSMVRQKEQFIELKKRLDQGENLLIIEVDGPHQESLPYYQDKYSVNDNFIDQHSVLATQENLNILLNDEKHPFGHGYCLAMALLDLDINVV